jgi:5'-nucleotidase
MVKPLILISNDDGIRAPGIVALYDALRDIADVVVVAPDYEQSGVGQGITLHRPLRIRNPQENWYAIDGTPADCVIVATRHILKRKPDWVISGFNRGANLGQDTLYSGTVAAAMEGLVAGISSMAVSLVLKPGDHENYEGCQKIVAALIKSPILKESSGGTVLNVNVPCVNFAEIKGFAITRLGWRIYDDRLMERVDPRGNKYYWIGGGGVEHAQTDGTTDCEKVKDLYVSLTALHTDHAKIDINDQLLSKVLTNLNASIGV